MRLCSKQRSELKILKPTCRAFIMAKHLIMYCANELFFNESSDSEDEIEEKIDNFAEVTVPNMSSKQFQRHFRLKVKAFENLLQMLNSFKEPRRRKRGHQSMSIEKELLITIWFLSNTESFRTIANRFGVTRSTTWEVVARTCNLLLQVNIRFNIINWPNRRHQEEIVAGFTKKGFPGTIGAIDGSHIPIVAPKEHHASYINRKGYHSLLLQAVCDDTNKFTHVYCGEAGSIHDMTLYKRSDLAKKIIDKEFHLYDNTHLIGDAAYKLAPHLIVPFKKYGHLTYKQKNFNFLHSKARVTIENAFALLKGRFRRLKALESKHLEVSVKVIMSACILHNICLRNDDGGEDLIDIEEERTEERRNHPYNEVDCDILNNVEQEVGTQKRNAIMNELPAKYAV